MNPKDFDADAAVKRFNETLEKDAAERLKEMDERVQSIFDDYYASATVQSFQGNGRFGMSFSMDPPRSRRAYTGSYTGSGTFFGGAENFWESMREQAEQGRRARQGSRESWGEEQRRRQQERGGPSRRSGPYAVLGVDEWCDKATALEAYRREAKVRHPDVGGSKEAFQELQNAWDSVKEMRGW